MGILMTAVSEDRHHHFHAMFIILGGQIFVLAGRIFVLGVKNRLVTFAWDLQISDKSVVDHELGSMLQQQADARHVLRRVVEHDVPRCRERAA